MAARLHPSPPSPELIDLRRLSARDLEPLLEEETAAWREELDWDFEKSADLVRRFVVHVRQQGPRSRQQRPYSLQTIRTFSMPLSGITARPLLSGAADAAVANNAPAPSASEMTSFFMLNSM